MDAKDRKTGGLVELVTRKSMQIRPSGRSTDFIAPSFGYGCLFNCGYCYMKRHMPEGLTVSKNIEDVLTAIDHHSWFADVEKPNQTHPFFTTYDIGCNEDLALHAKYYDMKKISKFFREHPKAYGSFATKYVNPKLLDLGPGAKMRIRFSLMPQKYADVLEPNTSSIIDRIQAIDKFIAYGWIVHINFSPVIVTEGWEQEYATLFQLVDKYVSETSKYYVASEVIFLTHNADKHKYNLDHGILGEELLWRPDIQEDKVSQYGGTNIRYKHNLKDDYIRAFKSLHELIIPWNTIRYIF
jgi:spore photoproduct lyase